MNWTGRQRFPNYERFEELFRNERIYFQQGRTIKKRHQIGLQNVKNNAILIPNTLGLLILDT